MDPHTFFGAHEDLVAIQMGGEGHALFLDLAQAGKREYLKTAAVRQNRLFPSHKLVEAAHFANHFITGAKMQMVGIGKLHLTSDLLQVFGADGALDGSLRSNIHKNGGLHHSVGAGELTAAGIAAGFDNSKHQITSFLKGRKQPLAAPEQFPEEISLVYSLLPVPAETVHE